MAFLGAFLAVSVAGPARALAQSAQVQEVRASKFTLVGPDGTILATLSPSSFTGDALLNMYDAGGTRRLQFAGTGIMDVYDQDGVTHVFRAGRNYVPGPRGGGLVNGVQLDKDGSISVIPTEP